MTSSAIPRARAQNSLPGRLALGWGAWSLASWGVANWMGLSDLYALKVAASFAVIVVLIAQSAERHHPFARFGPANLVTIVRAALTAGIAGTIGERAGDELAIAVVTVGLVIAVMDGLDGWLARRTGLSSDFGARFDMETDALLVLVLSILVWQFQKAGPWIVLAGLLRYVYVAAGWARAWMTAPLPESLRRKAICVVQIAGLAAVLLPIVQPPASSWLSAALLAALSYSFAADIIWLWRRVE